MRKSQVIERLDDRFFLGIAHRGLHNAEFSENGLKAFQNAIDNNMAFELDVHLSKDNELIVCHDSNLERMTGKPGIIEELTSQEIRENYRLLDGGVVPTLQEVLDLNHEQVPMVIELKARKKNDHQIGKRSREILNNIKDYSKYMIISFYPVALIHAYKKVINSLLLSVKHLEMSLTSFLFNSIDTEYITLNTKKLKRLHKYKIMNTWTIESIEDLEANYELSDMFTFQHIDPNYVKERLKNKREEILK